MIVVAIVAAIAFGALTLVLGLWVTFTLWFTLRRSAWRTIAGKVTDSRVVSNRRANGLPGHYRDVGYEFSIQNHEYRASRLRFGDFRYLSPTRAKQVVAKYPVGSAVTVCHDAAFIPELSAAALTVASVVAL